MKLEYLIVIPARINSTRLPRKLLMEINGISIIQRTYKRALQAINEPEKIIIATDSEEIRDHCNNFNNKNYYDLKELFNWN